MAWTEPLAIGVPVALAVLAGFGFVWKELRALEQRLRDIEKETFTQRGFQAGLKEAKKTRKVR